ncbi:uncharacterized protein HMPREF1541_06196 [Cyphellophora europaea CBS 101466]|uniref:Major facilitator superfamily (MFS) profile domain-containing protein n=1 Tax=Cyphellophora europaea (strain CBS 101466) TaxID=1220924 RepID=W2RWB1_CYPE1|nr:uncharacterized protein HMPREF1541_06196 [Cyphellophora europaea CBS 101466]ETN39969.1 hypothetical protein HMPREF1541_06196 [Cyphellophora europaea CBS 101466]
MLSRLRGSALVWAITLSCASCYLLFGYDQGVLGGLVTQPSLLNALGNPSAGYLGTIVALYNIGCLAGCVISAIWGNVLGRKRSILIGCSIMVVGATIQTSSFGAPQMIAGRLITGVGNGMNTSTVPVYVAETSKQHRRGAMIALQLSVVIMGIVLAYWLDYASVRTLSGEIVWRFPVGFQIVFALVTMATLPFLPDTPRWLYSHGRKAEAIDALARLMDTTIDDSAVQNIKTQMEDALQLEHAHDGGSLKTLLYDKSPVRKTRRLVLCFMIYFMQMFTGINVIAFYVTIVLEVNVGLSKETSSLVAGFVQMAFWLGTLPPIYMLDKYGRRKTMLWGSVALSISMILFTIGIALNTPATNRLALAMLFVYEISFGMSWNSMPWLYAAEITPLEIRHIGGAVGPFSEWLWTFVIVIMTPAAVENTGWRIYILFCVMLVLSIPFVYFFLPETANKTLEEIDLIFLTTEEKADLELSLAHPDQVAIATQYTGSENTATDTKYTEATQLRATKSP